MKEKKFSPVKVDNQAARELYSAHSCPLVFLLGNHQFPGWSMYDATQLNDYLVHRDPYQAQ